MGIIYIIISQSENHLWGILRQVMELMMIKHDQRVTRCLTWKIATADGPPPLDEFHKVFHLHLLSFQGQRPASVYTPTWMSHLFHLVELHKLMIQFYSMLIQFYTIFLLIGDLFHLIPFDLLDWLKGQAAGNHDSFPLSANGFPSKVKSDSRCTVPQPSSRLARTTKDIKDGI